MQKLTRTCSTSDYMHQLSFLLAVRERETVSMQGTVFTLARLKIVPSYNQETVSHPIPQHIEALS